MADKNIVIVTDCEEVALEQIKARLISILSNNNDNINFFNLIAKPFQINNGMFLFKLISEEVPLGENTLFLAIVNPSKIKPKRIFGKLKNGTWFVGADTGIFSLLFKEFGIKEVYTVKNQEHYPFGGLHIHTVIAGNLLLGNKEEEFGTLIAEKEILKKMPSKGEVLHIDNFGLIKVWARMEDFNFIEGDKVSIKILNSNRIFEGIFSNRMMNYEDNALIVYPGSSMLDKSRFDNIEEYRKSGLIEIGLVRNPNSAKELGINLGDIVEIKKIS